MRFSVQCFRFYRGADLDRCGIRLSVRVLSVHLQNCVRSYAGDGFTRAVRALELIAGIPVMRELTGQSQRVVAAIDAVSLFVKAATDVLLQPAIRQPRDLFDLNNILPRLLNPSQNSELHKLWSQQREGTLLCDAVEAVLRSWVPSLELFRAFVGNDFDEFFRILAAQTAAGSAIAWRLASLCFVQHSQGFSVLRPTAMNFYSPFASLPAFGSDDAKENQYNTKVRFAWLLRK